MKILIYFVLVIGTAGLLALSYASPWARGTAIIVGQTVYPDQEQRLQIVIGVTSALWVIFLMFAIMKKRLITGFIGLIIGSGVVAFGIYIWGEILDKSVFFVLKFVDVKPGIGLMFYIGAGGVIALFSLIYLLDAAISSVLNRSSTE